MPYAIQTMDKPNSLSLRTEKRAEHVAYLKAHLPKLLAGGALLEDDASGGFGGIVLLDTDDRAEAEGFVANDPYTLAGLFDSVRISRWRKAFFDGKSLV
jgi:uncharacterized protein YciI